MSRKSFSRIVVDMTHGRMVEQPDERRDMLKYGFYQGNFLFMKFGANRLGSCWDMTDRRTDRHPKFGSFRHPDQFDTHNSISNLISFGPYKQPLVNENYFTLCNMLQEYKNEIETVKKLIASKWYAIHWQ